MFKFREGSLPTAAIDVIPVPRYQQLRDGAPPTVGEFAKIAASLPGPIGRLVQRAVAA